MALGRAEQKGIRLDVEYCKKKRAQLEQKIERKIKIFEKTDIYKTWGKTYRNKTNIFSNHQLSHILYSKMGFSPSKQTDKGKAATDEESLKRLELKELDILLDIRKLSKAKVTYIEGFLKEETNGFIHPFFNLHLVRTFRSSSDSPNFQNIPVRDKEAMEICRRAILSRPGYQLVEADFSAIEVTVSLFYHEDPIMKKYLLDKNSDMHLDMARQIFLLPEMTRKEKVFNDLRSAAKTNFVFPQFYGDYYLNNALSLADWIKLSPKNWRTAKGIILPDGEGIKQHFRKKGIRTFDDFAEHMKNIEYDFWNRRFKIYNRWRKNAIKEYKKKGFLQMKTGFICSGKMRDNEIFNYPIQGTAFHCLLYTYIELDKFIQKNKLKTILLGQIHDSILMDMWPSEKDIIKNTLESIIKDKMTKKWKWITVPLEIETEEYPVDGCWIKG